MYHFLRYEILNHMVDLAKQKQNWDPGKIAEHVMEKNYDRLNTKSSESQIDTFLALKAIALELVEEQCGDFLL